MQMRENFFDAINQKSSRYLPFDLELCPALQEEFKRCTGAVDYLDYYNAPIRNINVRYRGDTSRFHHYFTDLENVAVGDWGIGYKRSGAAHFTEKLHPMQGFTTLEEFERYPYPVVEDYDTASLKAECARIKQNDRIVNARLTQTMFEKAWQMRGMEEFLMDLLAEPELADYLLERLFRVQKELAKAYVAAGCDILSLGDDVATQNGMMISKEVWRTFLKGRMATIIREAKQINPNVKIFYHCCGKVDAIIDELIEIGVDILNPIQPECMDIGQIKQRYGKNLILWGGLGTQQVMPFTDAENVRQVCRSLIENIGCDGGFILSPAHVLEPEVPFENIEAFLDCVKAYNEQ